MLQSWVGQSVLSSLVNELQSVDLCFRSVSGTLQSELQPSTEQSGDSVFLLYWSKWLSTLKRTMMPITSIDLSVCLSPTGLLRAGYYDILIDIHLCSYATARLMMNNEYIVPMTDETKSITLFPDEEKKHGLPGIGLSTSLRPRMHFSSPSFVCGTGSLYHNNGSSGSGDCFQYSPEFPLDILKIKTIEMLTEAVREGSMHVRDPIGGSTEFLFVPLIKLFYTMLIMGVFKNGDLKNILHLIEPSVFSEKREGQEETHKDTMKDVENEGGEDGGRNMPKEGLLQMKLPEPVKLQVNSQTLSS